MEKNNCSEGAKGRSNGQKGGEAALARVSSHGANS